MPALGPVPVWRASHRLFLAGHPRLARALKLVNYLVFRAVLPPEMEVGRDLRLGHWGLNVVIHPNTTIGDDVYILHGVTIATDVIVGSPERRYIGDRCMIGTGAVVLGPGSVGHDARIGAGAIVTRDVTAGTTVVGNPARPIGAAP